VIKNVDVVNEGEIQRRDVYIKNGRFEKISPQIDTPVAVREIDGEGLCLIPGLIDDQVHFREPGLTHKACIATESRAAIAGGVTSFMDMPNVQPASLNMSLLEERYAIASRTSPANYSFYLGVSNDNAEQALEVNQHKQAVCGIKIFMGSSTGNMLVDNIITLEKIFAESEVLIATHCEQEHIIHQNRARLKAEGAELNHARFHPIIRDVEACYESSVSAMQLAKKFNTRLHILHITTEKELQLFTNLFPLSEKRITSEVCVHHLHYTADDYEQYGNLIQCNPAIKAPHHKEAPSGLPLVQHSLLMLLQARREGRISLEKIVEKACHAPAQCFQIRERGYIREGYHADFVLLDLKGETTVSKDQLYYRCGWSTLEGQTLPGRIHATYVNGQCVFALGSVIEGVCGQRLLFDRP
jgi:dihydroorotase